MSSTVDPSLLTSFSIDEAAKTMSVSPDIIRAHVRSGALRAYDASFGQSKKRWRITARALLDFQERRSNVSVPKPPSLQRRRNSAASTPTQYV